MAFGRSASVQLANNFICHRRLRPGWSRSISFSECGPSLGIPPVSLPAACNGWSETLAAYRFFDNAKVTSQRVLLAHAASNLERAREHAVVLCLQDTTGLDYSGTSDIEGPGRLTYETQRGLYLHPTFLVSPDRQPLGVVDATIWARDPEQSKVDRHQRPIEQKESFRWLSGYRHLLSLQADLPDTQLVKVTVR